jgi:hypothetical protein
VSAGQAAAHSSVPAPVPGGLAGPAAARGGVVLGLLLQSTVRRKSMEQPGRRRQLERRDQAFMIQCSRTSVHVAAQ